jgi:hypothetical protein
MGRCHWPLIPLRRFTRKARQTLNPEPRNLHRGRPHPVTHNPRRVPSHKVLPEQLHPATAVLPLNDWRVPPDNDHPGHQINRRGNPRTEIHQ